MNKNFFYEDDERVILMCTPFKDLRIILEPDRFGNAAVIKSMVSALDAAALIESEGCYNCKQNNYGQSEVGDVLVAINGEEVFRKPHKEVIKLLDISMGIDDSFTRVKDGNVKISLLSFKDPSHYYRQLHKNALDVYITRKLGKGMNKESDLNSADEVANFDVEGKDDLTPTGSGFSKMLSKIGKRLSSSGLSIAYEEKDQSNLSNQGLELSLEAWKEFNNGNYQASLTLFNALLDCQPRNYLLRLCRYRCYTHLGNHKMAYQDAHICTFFEPELPAAYLFKGIALDSMGLEVKSFKVLFYGFIFFDPEHCFFRWNLEEFFVKKKWQSISITERSIVDAFVEALGQNGLPQKDRVELHIDRIVVFKNSTSLKAFFSRIDSLCSFEHNDVHGYISVHIKNTESSEQLLDENSCCDIFDGDEIFTVNFTTITSLEDYENSLNASPSVVILGIVSGSRIATSSLLEGSQLPKTTELLRGDEAELLFAITVSGCGTIDANGTYLPQEIRNGYYVYENKNAYLLSFESIIYGKGMISGWVIGQSGSIVYSSVNKEQDEGFVLQKSASLGSFPSHEVIQEKMEQCSGEELISKLRKGKWRCFSGRPNTPNFYGFEKVRSVEETVNRLRGTHSTESTDLEDAYKNILVLKGYAARFLNSGNADTALTCYNLAENFIQELLLPCSDQSSEATMSESEWSAARNENLDHCEEAATTDFTANLELRSMDHMNDCKFEDIQALQYMLTIIWINKARALFDQGDIESTIEIIQCLQSFMNQNNMRPSPLSFYYLALAYAAKGSVIDGINSCQEALKCLYETSQDFSLKKKILSCLQDLRQRMNAESASELRTSNSTEHIQNELFEKDHLGENCENTEQAISDESELSEISTNGRLKDYYVDLKSVLNQTKLKVNDSFVLKELPTNRESKGKKKILSKSKDGLTLLFSTPRKFSVGKSSRLPYQVLRKDIDGILLGRVVEYTPKDGFKFDTVSCSNEELTSINENVLIEKFPNCITIVCKNGGLRVFRAPTVFARDNVIFFLASFLAQPIQ